MYNFSQHAMNHRALLSRIACFSVRSWQMYHDVSLLECLSKNFLPLNTGRMEELPSMSQSKRLKDIKNNCQPWHTIMKQSPFYTQDTSLSSSSANPSKRSIRSFRTESFDHYFFSVVPCDHDNKMILLQLRKTPAEIIKLPFFISFP